MKKRERERLIRKKIELEGSESCVFKKNLQKNRYRTATCNIEFERKFEIPPCLSLEREREKKRNISEYGKRRENVRYKNSSVKFPRGKREEEASDAASFHG